MGEVYSARDTRLGRTVAIKRTQERFSDRFQREARLALKLKHPNVVRTYHTDETDGLHYLVMEYLEGETLEEVLQRRGKLPPPEAVRLICQALAGLQHLLLVPKDRGTQRQLFFRIGLVTGVDGQLRIFFLQGRQLFRA